VSAGDRNPLGPARDRRVGTAAAALRRAGLESAELAVVLGSGLSSFADDLENARVIPYSKIPGMPTSAVAGHRGAAILGTLGGRRAVILSGRAHHYEGLPVADVTFGVRLAAELGVRALIVTNASGGIDPGFEVGDLMLIADQISMLGGPRRLTGRTFRMGGAYSARLRALAREVALENGVPLREGVYMGSLGPTYETPAEIRMARLFGASAVGMSTVTEVQTAFASGIEVMGVALITNVPLPGRFEVTTHREVLSAGRAGGGQLLSLVSKVALGL
jgi:purine-nucleoside phosphorylase